MNLRDSFYSADQRPSRIAHLATYLAIVWLSAWLSLASAQEIEADANAEPDTAAKVDEPRPVRTARGSTKRATKKPIVDSDENAEEPSPADETDEDKKTRKPGATPKVKKEAAGPRGIRFGEERVQKIKVGVRIKAGGECKGITASIPVPFDWPEQQVRIIDEDVSASVRSVDYRMLEGGVRQMLIVIPRLPAKEEAEAVLTFEVRRKVILPPEQTDVYEIPKSPDRSIKRFLGDSPFIESRNSRIRTLAREITKDKPNAWTQVEAIYDYVRANVEYRESELKGAVDALRDKHGDCEAMTSLFIALARAAKIPARMVWVTDHSYPEFYLEDEAGEGHWFPCQISGGRAFGEMPETRTILQKGDNYKDPDTRERRRYVAVQLQANAVRGGSPKVTEVTEYVQ